MENFKIINTNLNDLKIIKTTKYKDKRGFFYESYKLDFFKKLKFYPVQDNISNSKKNVLRGLHLQNNYSQAKLITCITGRILDISVDLRKTSSTYLNYFSIELNDKNENSLYIPKNFAHGYLVLEKNTTIYYKTDEYYHPEYESGIIWNDKKLNINWNLPLYRINENDLIISKKDSNLPNLK